MDIVFDEAIKCCEALDKEVISAATAFAGCLYAKDIGTYNHSKSVAFLCVKMAEILGLDEQIRGSIFLEGLLHDIGKIGISDAIIKKSAALSPDEYDIIKEHPVIGERILSGIPGFDEIGNIIKHHHEKYDGSGYPDGLSGEGIPLESRIITVADSFDAMTTRGYTNIKNNKNAIYEIKNCVGSQFDFEIAESLFELKI